MSIKQILMEHAPEELTDRDVETLKKQDVQAKLYNMEEEGQIDITEDDLLAMQEEVNISSIDIQSYVTELFNVIDEDSMTKQRVSISDDAIEHPYHQVASTCDEEYLGNDNLLFSVDGIDTHLLSNVLAIHSKTRAVDEVTAKDIEKALEGEEKMQYKRMTLKVPKASGECQTDYRAQLDGKNMLLYSEDVVDNEGLEDMVDDKEQAKINAKRRDEQGLIKLLKTKLNATRKDYHSINDMLKTAVGDDRVQLQKKLKDSFAHIRRYQSRLERIEKAIRDYNQKMRHLQRQKIFNYYLDKFVDYQQDCIKKNIDIKWTREDVENKYNLREPRISEYVPSFKRAA